MGDNIPARSPSLPVSKWLRVKCCPETIGLVFNENSYEDISNMLGAAGSTGMPTTLEYSKWQEGIRRRHRAG